MILVGTTILLVVLLMLLGLPVAFAFGIGGFIYLLASGANMLMAVPAGFTQIDSYILLALPLFIIMGSIIQSTGVSRRLIDFVLSAVGQMRGGLGVVMIVVGTIFGAISGSASAAIAAIGTVMIPQMVENGYDRGYATGLMAVTSILSLLVPPSVTMIVFAMTAQISIAAAFLSTLGPAIFLMIWFSIINLFLCRRMEGIKVTPYLGLKKQTKLVVISAYKAAFALAMPLVILGGIYGGVFTPTEAAAVASVYAAFIGFFVYRSLHLQELGAAIRNGAVTSGVIIILLFFIMMLSRSFITMEVPQQLSSALLSISGGNKYVVLLLLNIILLLMGMIMDDVSGNVLSAAILLPVAVQIGISPIHFAAISVTNLGLGNITPPVAPMLYLAGRIGGNLHLNEYIKPATIYMVLGFLPIILAVTYIPGLATFLPRLITGHG